MWVLQSVLRGMVGRWAKVKINRINVNSLHLTVLPYAVFWPLPMEQDPTTQIPTLNKLYIL